MLPSRTLLCLGLFSLLLAPSAASQSAADVFREMRDAYERRMSDVRDYTIVQEVMGVSTTSYFVREMMDGHPVFRLERVETNGMTIDRDEDDGGWDQIYAMADEFAEHATYVGREVVDGRQVHVVEVTDLETLGMDPDAPDDGVTFESDRARIFVDGDDWVVRRVTFAGTMVTDQGSSDVTMTMDFSDFRTVDGMVHPFVMRMAWQGMQAMSGMSPDEVANMRKQLEEMKAQLAEMPEAQRKMVEGMMKGQMERIESMLAEGGDGMTVEMQVTELRVNTGG